MQSRNERQRSSVVNAKKILGANPLDYKFFDNEIKNKYARAYLDGFKMALRSTGSDMEKANALFQPAWDEWAKGRSNDCAITKDQILPILGDQEKAVSKTKYYKDKAAQSGPVGRTFYKIAQSLSSIGDLFGWKNQVDVSADKDASKTQSSFAKWYEEQADRKISIGGKYYPVGSFLSVAGLALSCIAVTIASIATFGAGLPLALVIASTVMGVSGAVLGIVGGEIASNHDRHKGTRDSEKLLGDACDVANQATKEQKQELAKEANSIARDLLIKEIDKSSTKYQKGRDISDREWFMFALKALTGATVPFGDIVGGPVGAIVKAAGALGSTTANIGNVYLQRKNHNNEVQSNHRAKCKIAGKIVGLNKKLDTPLKSQQMEKGDVFSNDLNSMEFKTTQWAKQWEEQYQTSTPTSQTTPSNNQQHNGVTRASLGNIAAPTISAPIMDQPDIGSRIGM